MDSNVQWRTRNTDFAEHCPESLRLFARCIPSSPYYGSHRRSLGPLCLLHLHFMGWDNFTNKSFFAFFFLQMMSLPLILEILGMYLFWRVWEPARCSLRSWSSCRWCRVHSATCTLSRWHPSSRQTGCCMMLMTSWQSTSHLYVDV